MIKSLMIKYLRRRGYLVIENRVPMLLISGNAVAITADKLDWKIRFPTMPFLVVLNGSQVVVTGGEK